MFWKKKLKHNCMKDDDFFILESGILIHDGQVTGFWQEKRCKICGQISHVIKGMGCGVLLTNKIRKELGLQITKKPKAKV
jgi:hypothetical protein